MIQRVFDPRDPVLVATIATTDDAREQARVQERKERKWAEDRFDFRAMRAAMQGNRGTL